MPPMLSNDLTKAKAGDTVTTVAGAKLMIRSIRVADLVFVKYLDYGDWAYDCVKQDQKVCRTNYVEPHPLDIAEIIPAQPVDRIAELAKEVVEKIIMSTGPLSYDDDKQNLSSALIDFANEIIKQSARE